MCVFCVFFNEEQERKVLLMVSTLRCECACQKERSRVSWPYACVKHDCIFFFVYFGLSLGKKKFFNITMMLEEQ
jgi:hypothetical protein